MDNNSNNDDAPVDHDAGSYDVVAYPEIQSDPNNNHFNGNQENVNENRDDGQH